MARFGAIVVSLVALSLLAARGDDTPEATAWKYDVVYRKKGEPLKGLVLEDGPDAVRVRCILRRAGKPTVLITENVPRRDVARLDLLDKADRAELQKRLEKLKAERDRLAARLDALGPRAKSGERSDDALALKPAEWPIDRKVQALSYRSTYFTLIANASPELAELAAIQLEQVYAAYARTLPPRHPQAGPTTILVTRSLAEYQALAKAHGLSLFNPAFYDPGKNQVVCGSDLERLREERDKVVRHHKELRAAMKSRRADLAKLYRGKVPAELVAPMAKAEKRIGEVEKKNEVIFKASQERLFRRLYHEAFHAYVGTFVYPAKEGALPLWLNEGLAQLFETAILEAGELRVRHADPQRLRLMRKAIDDKTFLPLAELIGSEGKNFQVAHASDKQVSDRYYLASWAVAFHLTFGQPRLGTEELDAYVKALKRGTEPLLAFRDLVGQPLGEYEKGLIAYLNKLKADGTTASR